MESNRNLSVLFLVLIVFGQCDFRSWQVVYLTLRAVRAQTVGCRVTAGRLLLSLIAVDEVLDVLVLGQVRHFLIVD